MWRTTSAATGLIQAYRPIISAILYGTGRASNSARASRTARWKPGARAAHGAKSGSDVSAPSASNRRRRGHVGRLPAQPLGERVERGVDGRHHLPRCAPGGAGRVQDAGTQGVEPGPRLGRDGDDRDAEPVGEGVGVDLDAGLGGGVGHVERDDDREAEVEHLRHEVQVALEVRRVGDADDDVGLGLVRDPPDEGVEGDPLVDRFRVEAVRPRQVDDLDAAPPVAAPSGEVARLALDGDAGVVGHLWWLPVSALNRVVLPTFGFPASATVRTRAAGVGGGAGRTVSTGAGAV